MRFSQLEVDGAWLVELEPRSDERGFFARTWCREEFLARGVDVNWAQGNTSLSVHAGTMRGLHWQVAPHSEAKLVRCLRGRVFDVVADVRHDSPTFLRWVGVELTEDGRQQLFVPPGCAHGYLTLTDQAEVAYSASAPYAPQAERGLRWDDPAFGIAWPMTPRHVTPKDRAWPDFVRVGR